MLNRLSCRLLLVVLAVALPVLARAASPTISPIPDQTIDANSETGNLDFTVDDAETSPANLTLSRNSSDLNLVPLSGITFSGSGMNRRVNVTPAANQTGLVTITVTVTDGDANSTSTTFKVRVNPAVVSFRPATLAGINDKQTSRPLAGGNIAASDPISVTIQLPNGRGSFPLSAGFTNQIVGPNVFYELSSRSVSAARTFLTNLVFTPVQNRIPIGEDETTTFTVVATDGSSGLGTNSIDLTVTPVNDPPRILGLVITSIPDNQATKLFAAMTIQDPDVVRLGGVITNQPVSVTVSNGIASGGLPTFGGYQNQTNPFTLSDTPARVTSTLTNIQFLQIGRAHV